MNIIFAFAVLFLQYLAIEGKKDLEKITNTVFFDIEIGGKAAGRIVIGLFGIKKRS